MEKVNLQVEIVNGSYRANLNRLQQSDHSQIMFVKQALSKFGGVINQFGKMMSSHADLILDGADIVTAETDLRIFIEQHKTDNPMV